MEKNKYSAPTAELLRFSSEYIAAGSAIGATEEALKNGVLKVNGEDVSTKPILSFRF